jgi:GNAT superfamily N-acetyltransferase
MFGEAYEPELKWGAASVIDDVAEGKSVDEISRAFSSVGFNTIPAWLRPYKVLSNGERFRADLARRMLELDDPVVVDEFTSVVDRQVAKIGAHAVQKWVRKGDRKFVAVTCHYDVIDWLQPDWILEPATMAFQWRLLQQRPTIEVTVARVDYSLWKVFAPYHYLTADLASHAAKSCYALFVNEQPVSFAGIIHFPHPKTKFIKRLSRLVTLPDWQGLGLAFALADTVCGAYKSFGYRVRAPPAHPSLIRAFDRSKSWALKKKPGTFAAPVGASGLKTIYKSRPCAVFEYVGPERDEALELIWNYRP